jgi:hypothetical protein
MMVGAQLEQVTRTAGHTSSNKHGFMCYSKLYAIQQALLNEYGMSNPPLTEVAAWCILTVIQ